MSALMLSILLSIIVFVFLVYSMTVSAMPLLYLIGFIVCLIIFCIIFLFIGYIVFFIRNQFFSKSHTVYYEFDDFIDELFDIIEKKQEDKKGKDL